MTDEELPRPELEPRRSEPPRSAADGDGGKWNLPWITLGGMQTWRDEFVQSGWRIQRNVFTGRCRVLDPRDLHRGGGTGEQCRAVIERARAAGRIAPLAERVVIVLHGLFRSRRGMYSLVEHLRSVRRDWSVLDVGYPTTRSDVHEHAAGLAAVFAGIGPEVRRIDFVGHSLGNIVLRRYLAGGEGPERAHRPADAPSPVWRPDERLARVVMLGPPNHGSEIARVAAQAPLVPWICGRSLVELGLDWPRLHPLLATPAEFGVIAGATGTQWGFNPLLPGDNDGVVTVTGTRLAGEADFQTVRTVHALLIRSATVFDATVRFLEQGRFGAVAPPVRSAS